MVSCVTRLDKTFQALTWHLSRLVTSPRTPEVPKMDTGWIRILDDEIRAEALRMPDWSRRRSTRQRRPPQHREFGFVLYFRGAGFRIQVPCVASLPVRLPYWHRTGLLARWRPGSKVARDRDVFGGHQAWFAIVDLFSIQFCPGIVFGAVLTLSVMYPAALIAKGGHERRRICLWSASSNLSRRYSSATTAAKKEAEDLIWLKEAAATSRSLPQRLQSAVLRVEQQSTPGTSSCQTAKSWSGFISTSRAYRYHERTGSKAAANSVAFGPSAEVVSSEPCKESKDLRKVHIPGWLCWPTRSRFGTTGQVVVANKRRRPMGRCQSVHRNGLPRRRYHQDCRHLATSTIRKSRSSYRSRSTRWACPRTPQG
jgi:hypothetical protein